MLRALNFFLIGRQLHQTMIMFSSKSMNLVVLLEVGQFSIWIITEPIVGDHWSSCMSSCTQWACCIPKPGLIGTTIFGTFRRTFHQKDVVNGGRVIPTTSTRLMMDGACCITSGDKGHTQVMPLSIQR